MTYKETTIPGVWIIEPKVFTDQRGYFFEAFKQEEFDSIVGGVRFVQDNESRSTKGVLRGLHYQLAPYAQSKLVRVIKGRVLDVAVELSDENKRQLFIPQGFAHGFHVLSDEAIFTYKVDNPYMPSHERGIRYDDPTIQVEWGITDPAAVNLSAKDTQAPTLAEAENNFSYKR